MIDAGSTYVALGSSFAAGPGIRPVTHRGARRSALNYPHLVAERLSLRLVDVTCSGATTANVLREWQHRLPPQIDAVTPDAKLVTITIGGNDVGYIGGLVRVSMRCALADRFRVLPDTWHEPAPDVPAEQFATLVDSLVNVVDATRSRAPGARILLVDYLTVFGPDAHRCKEIPLDDAAVERTREIAAGVAKAIRAAAERSAVGLVAASDASSEHGAGSAQPWVTGWGNPLRGHVPYHPTPAGMTAVADLVVRAVV